MLPELAGLNTEGWIVLMAKSLCGLGAFMAMVMIAETWGDQDIPQGLRIARGPIMLSFLLIFFGQLVTIPTYPDLAAEARVMLNLATATLGAVTAFLFYYYSKPAGEVKHGAEAKQES